MTLLVLLALGMLSALALTDATQSARVAALGEDEARARAALLQALERLSTPPDVPWLCLQPPAQPTVVLDSLPDGSRIERRWWMVRPGVVRVEVVGIGVGGSRKRRIGWLRPDSLEPPGPAAGCPRALRLEPVGVDWLEGHPEG
jgi:hypothetical protein